MDTSKLSFIFLQFMLIFDKIKSEKIFVKSYNCSFPYNIQKYSLRHSELCNDQSQNDKILYEGDIEIVKQSAEYEVFGFSCSRHISKTIAYCGNNQSF